MMKIPYRITIILLSVNLLSCNIQDKPQENSKNFLGSQQSLNLEQENIQRFFENNDLKLKIDQTHHVDPYRIFLHYFTASENEIRQIIKILELDSVTHKDFKEIHLDNSTNADFRIYGKTGQAYLKDAAILFYKAESSNKKAQQELKVKKVYLYFDKNTGEACFQIYHGWG